MIDCLTKIHQSGLMGVYQLDSGEVKRFPSDRAARLWCRERGYSFKKHIGGREIKPSDPMPGELKR